MKAGAAKGSVQRRRPRKGLRDFLPTSVQKSYFMLSDAEREVLNSALEKYQPGQSEPILVRGKNLLGVFAYPRKKVQSRISSRLENDPLPLLSVFIDNTHVDEVQIDGRGTEAVITGNMENPGKRLIVLEGDAVEALYGRPPLHTRRTSSILRPFS